MKPTVPGERLTIYLNQLDHRGHTPGYVEIVERARRAGLAGATVLKASEGFGAPSRLHTRRAWAVSEDVPVVVVIVDRPERIAQFLATLDDLAVHGLTMVREPVEMIVYRRERTRHKGFR